MGWSDIWSGVEGAFGMGGDDAAASVAATAPGAVAPNDPAVMAGVSAQDVADIDGASPAVKSGASNPAWWEKPIKQMMPMIMGAALHPGAQARAPVAPSGHGVSANGSSELKIIDELRSASSNNPLDDLNKWSGLFK